MSAAVTERPEAARTLTPWSDADHAASAKWSEPRPDRLLPPLQAPHSSRSHGEKLWPGATDSSLGAHAVAFAKSMTARRSTAHALCRQGDRCVAPEAGCD